jgi:hypothetical protein
MAGIVLQADEVLVKPFDVKQLADLVRKKTQKTLPPPRPSKESVASIVERDATITITRWLSPVNQTEALTSLALTDKERTLHFRDHKEHCCTSAQHPSHRRDRQ